MRMDTTIIIKDAEYRYIKSDGITYKFFDGWDVEITMTREQLKALWVSVGTQLRQTAEPRVHVRERPVALGVAVAKFTGEKK